MEDNKKVKKFILSLAISTAVFLFLLIGLVVWIDPFFHYHKPLAWFPYKVDNQLSANAGMAKNFEYDGILTGSSMVSNFDLKGFEENLGQKIIKINYNGAAPKDISNILEYVFKEHEAPSVVYYGLDVYGYCVDVDAVKYPFPEYLYNDNVFDDVSYVFNKDVLVDYIIEPFTWPSEKTDLSEVYIMEYEDWQYSKDHVLQYYTLEDIQTMSSDNYKALMECSDNNLEQNLIPYIEAHPETEFVVFYPPYSILYWYTRMREDRLELTKDQYIKITNRLLDYPNVRVFNFCGMEDTITDLSNYVDFNHQHRRVNDYIMTCFASGELELKKDNYEEQINKMFDFFKNYDYEAEYGFENICK